MANVIGARYEPREAVAADVDALVPPGHHLRLVGFSCREIAGSPAVATFRIVHGSTAAEGDAIIPVELLANESAREWYGPHGIETPRGLSIDWIAGVVDIVLFYREGPDGG